VVFTPPGGGAIRALNARTREASDILRADPGERFRLPVPSPDGKWIAYVRVRTGRPEAKPKSGGGAHMVETIEVGPLGGGEARTLITLRGGGAKSIGWLPGSKDVIVTSPGRPDGAAPAELVWRVSIDGGAARRLFELPSRGGVQLSPDGGKIAYASGAVKTELRLLRLPAGRRNSSAVFRSDRIHLGGNRRSIQPKE
jgi:Tol biopolymer transport system component